MASPIVTLTTDWGYRDFFTGKVKGKLYSYIPGVQVVDISHGIENYDVLRAAFIVNNGCLGFPPGTIHIIDIKANQDCNENFVVVEYAEQYFICTDNGLPDIVFGDRFTRAVEIDGIPHESDFYTFAASDLFCRIAAKLAEGCDFYSLGNKVDELNHYRTLSTNIYDDHIRVHITYIDHYGNADLNITYDEFEKIRAGRAFVMNVNGHNVSSIQHSYLDRSSENGKSTGLLLLVSASGHLQIALREASAEQLIGLRVLACYDVIFK